LAAFKAEALMTGPTTAGGEFLRACVRGNLDEVDEDRVVRSGRQFDAVWSTAFALAARRRFARVPDLREVTHYVAQALARMDMPTGGRQAREAEALIRWMLGEWDPVEGIEQDDLSKLTGVLLIDLARQDYRSDAELDDFIATAESLSVRFTAAKPAQRGKSRWWRR
jgi:hypothetical protein